MTALKAAIQSARHTPEMRFGLVAVLSDRCEPVLACAKSTVGCQAKVESIRVIDGAYISHKSPLHSRAKLTSQYGFDTQKSKLTRLRTKPAVTVSCQKTGI